MREFNLLSNLPESKEPRIVHPNIRTIKNRIIASERGKEFYDGDRNNGYGGYVHDQRWEPVARKIIEEYHIMAHHHVLQIGSEKGFLLHELKILSPKLTVKGIELSKYAIDKTIYTVWNDVSHSQYTWLRFPDQSFEFVIALGLYSLNLYDIIISLKEIQRVGRGKSFITLGAFETEEEERLFRQWTLLGTTILSKDDWREVLKHVGYTGDYWFNTAKTLNLVSRNDDNSELTMSSNVGGNADAFGEKY